MSEKIELDKEVADKVINDLIGKLENVSESIREIYESAPQLYRFICEEIGAPLDVYKGKSHTINEAIFNLNVRSAYLDEDGIELEEDEEVELPNHDKWYELQREVNQELWGQIMEEPYADNAEFENETFKLIPYSWDDCVPNDYHFWHKPSGLKIQWYKYPLRGAMTNMKITSEQLRAVLYDCMNSTHPRFTMDIKNEKWW